MRRVRGSVMEWGRSGMGEEVDDVGTAEAGAVVEGGADGVAGGEAREVEVSAFGEWVS
jgi:hypothetical protein